MNADEIVTLAEKYREAELHRKAAVEEQGRARAAFDAAVVRRGEAEDASSRVFKALMAAITQ